ncbi:hypothetical protein TWF694_010967 [Orbilia ellipsospora]|uniref:AMP-dependent synthetase/ligase domain-containing protein n=1 Tax=Orbilia ellipsospora TaxID=2528407 RepID=A0AAV9X7M1_9PEZI
MDTGFSLQQVLAVAKAHPLYNSDVEYPPTPKEALQIANDAKNRNDDTIDLTTIPLATKETLYPTLSRLFSDTNPKNSFRNASYLSITGGGSGGLPMAFATDVFENRNQRAATGALAKACGLIEPGDVVLTLHTSGGLYRSLDLVTEICETAGGTVFCGGHKLSMAAVLEILLQYKPNVISADGSQTLHFANYVSTLPDETRAKININKVIFTSDPITRDQRKQISSILGAQVFSIMGSAEAGSWAVANLDLTGKSDDDGIDFIFDDRMMKIEILPASAMDHLDQAGATVADGEKGIIVQTSLSRLRNPLLRYVTGDIGCLRPFPSGKVSSEDEQHLKIVRLYGRDRRFSFKWFGEYFEFPKVKELLQTSKGWNILQYQIVLSNLENKELQLELRLYRSSTAQEAASEEEIKESLESFFVVYEVNQHAFKVTFLDGLDGFERSKTGSKVINFVDRSNH